jgi:thiol:disulfide interchange protein DsbD
MFALGPSFADFEVPNCHDLEAAVLRLSLKYGQVGVLTLALGLIISLSLGYSAPAVSAPPDFLGGAEDVPIEPVVTIDELGIEPGGTGWLPIQLGFPSTHHLNSEPVPTLAITEPGGLKVGEIRIEGDSHTDPVLELEVYEGLVTLLVRIDEVGSLQGNYTLKGKLTYYPCSDVDLVCFEKTDNIQVPLRVEAGASSEVQAGAAGVEIQAGEAGKAGSSPLRNVGSGSLADRVTGAFAKSTWLAYLLVFVGGILASFTPCVYPMIPITVGVIGAGSAGSKKKGFQLSLIYVLGIAITYSIFGAAAAATGKAFGSFTQTFGVLLGIGFLLGLLGTSMLGFFEIRPPAFLSQLQSKQGKGYIGIFLMGAVTGLVASPCLGPVLLALLAWIAKTGDVFRGFTLLFVFAVGMGLLLIAIGTFASVLTALPKSGAWMIRVKEILGLILVGVGVYYIGLALVTRGIPEKATWTAVTGIVLLVAGFLVKGSEKAASEPETAGPAGVQELKVWLRKGVGVAMMVAGGYATVVGLSMGGLAPAWMRAGPVAFSTISGEGIQWSSSYDQGVAEAKDQNKPVIIDFYADWCVYCKKLDSDVFTDERIVNEAERFVTLKIDADERPDLAKDHAVLGLPTIVFLDSTGEEADRIESYVKADKFLGVMTSVR